MFRKAALLAVVATAGLAVTVAQASTAVSHHVRQPGEGAGIYHNGTGDSTFAGTLGSNGAVIEKRVFKSGNQTSFSGTATVFGPKGSYKGTITKGTVVPCSPTPCNAPPRKETAKVKVTDGGGLYKGATGTITITDSYIPMSAGFFKIVLAGTLDY